MEMMQKYQMMQDPSLMQPQRGQIMSPFPPQQMGMQNRGSMPPLPPLSMRGSPMDIGSMAAINATRNSLESSGGEDDLGNGLMDSMEDLYEPHESGRMLFGLGGLENALKKSAKKSKKSREENKKGRFDMNLKLLQREDDLRAQQEKNRMKIREMDETKRYHDILAGLSKEKIEKKSNKDDKYVETPMGTVDLSGYPKIKTSAERNLFSKRYNSFAQSNSSISSALGDARKLAELTKGSAFAPTGSLVGSGANFVKDIYGRLVPDSKMGSQLNEERLLREQLNSKLESLQPVLESALKQGGQPGEQMMKRFSVNKVYPKVTDPMDTIVNKLNYLEQETEEGKLLNKTSLMYGRQLPEVPEALKELHKDDEGEKKASKKAAVNISPEQIQAIRQQYPEMAQDSDEDIMEALRILQAEGD